MKLDWWSVVMHISLAYMVVRMPGFLIGQIANIFYRAIYFGRYACSLSSQIDGLHRIIIRANGHVALNNLKARVGLKVFCDGGKLVVGKNVFFNNNCSLNCMDSIVIGDGTIFGESVKIYDHNHMITDNEVDHNAFRKAPVIIGRNCWIGSNVVILPGVVIGDNVTIGAGAVITKSILPSPPGGVFVCAQGPLRRLR